MAYNEEDFLQLSGLQHFRFCRRQWALIHIEHQWAENYRTIDGAILHENAHDTDLQERRGDRFITRGVSVYSAELGVSGQCDVLEYHRGSIGIPLSGKEGLWQPYPVEYKRGRPREDTGDTLQLCAQAMCLESMLCCDIPEGALSASSVPCGITRPAWRTADWKKPLPTSGLCCHRCWLPLTWTPCGE